MPYVKMCVFSHNIKLWVSLTVRASMIVAIAGFPLSGPPRGDGRYRYHRPLVVGPLARLHSISISVVYPTNIGRMNFIQYAK